MFKQLQNKNKNINIVSVYDESFLNYGSLLSTALFFDAIRYLKEYTTTPKIGNKYIAHDEHFYQYLSSKKIYQEVIGDNELEFGYVNGNNSYLNALEYHKSPEINICVTPLVLLLGRSEDFQKGTFDSSKLKAFYIPKNTVIQINPYTFHFSPCKVVDSGFKCGVILPDGTNLNLQKELGQNSPEDPLLFKRNKWLIAHPDNHKLIQQGAFNGISGENLKIKY